jgi:hydroxyacylglutathione hydrolase
MIKKFKIIWLAAAFFGCATSSDLRRDGKFEVFSFRRSYSNTHLIKIGPEKFLMVDSGSYEDAPLLENDLRERDVDPQWIKAIVLTHGHWDHAGGARYFQDKFKTPVLLGARDTRLLENGKSDPLCPTSFIAKMRQNSDQERSFLAPKVTKLIDSQTPLDEWVGPGVGFIKPIPSHTEGSLAVVIDDLAFVGDLFRGSLIGVSATRHFYICDLERNSGMIRDFLNRDALDVKLFFPGHFGPSLPRASIEEFLQGM